MDLGDGRGGPGRRAGDALVLRDNDECLFLALDRDWAFWGEGR